MGCRVRNDSEKHMNKEPIKLPEGQGSFQHLLGLECRITYGVSFSCFQSAKDARPGPFIAGRRHHHTRRTEDGLFVMQVIFVNQGAGQILTQWKEHPF